jgi:hypothetical protein
VGNLFGQSSESTFSLTTALRAQATGGADLDLSFVEDSAITATDLTANWTENGNTLTYAITGAALPAGLSVSSAGLLTGTPTTPTADDTYTLRGTDEYGRTTDDTFALEVTEAPSGDLTISNFSEASDTLDLTSSEQGTCYYGIYPSGTVVGDITIADMIAGTDTDQIDNGTVGFIVPAATLDDVEIDDSALTAGVTYVVAFVVDIDDGGTYTDLALQTFTLGSGDGITDITGQTDGIHVTYIGTLTITGQTDGISLEVS